MFTHLAVVHMKFYPMIYTHSGDLAVGNSQVSTPSGSPKKIVNKPTGVAPTINVMVYAQFGGNTKIKFQYFTLDVSLI